EEVREGAWAGAADRVIEAMRYAASQGFVFSSRRRHTSWPRDWSSDVCSSDLLGRRGVRQQVAVQVGRGDHRVLVGTQYELREHRSEERRVGKECRSRWSREHLKQKPRARSVRTAP